MTEFWRGFLYGEGIMLAATIAVQWLLRKKPDQQSDNNSSKGQAPENGVDR